MGWLTRQVGVGRWGLLLLLALLPCAPAAAQARQVMEIRIQGNQRINEAAIRAAISTRVGAEYVPLQVERDREAVQALGWFSSVSAIPQFMGNNVQLTFLVTEYPLVQRVEITGSSIFSDEQIQAVTKTRPSQPDAPQVFNRPRWNEDLRAVIALYREKGYRIRLTENTVPGVEGYADFRDSGILRARIFESKVGDVKIVWMPRETRPEGTPPPPQPEQPREVRHKTRTYVVTRELSLKSGALYSDKMLGEDYRRLSGLGIFERVEPLEPAAGQELDTVDITWRITEKRTGQVSVGAGYSPRQRLIGRAELADQNFRGKGQHLGLSAEIGTFGGDGSPSFEVQFFEPWLTKDRTSLTVSLYDKLIYRFSRSLSERFDDDEDRYYERRKGGQISFGRPFRLPLTLGLRYDDVKTGDDLRFLDIPLADGTVIAGNVSHVRSTRDYPNNPTSGSFLRLSTELGHASFERFKTTPGDSSFFDKLIVDFRKYYRLKKLKATSEVEREQESQKIPVLAVRAMAGTLIGKVPFFEQYFMGGGETLRGYLEDRFWGNHMYLFSVEYRRPIMNRIVGVLFADVGDAFGSRDEFRITRGRFATDFPQHDGLRPYASVGLGLRVATPIGPIRLDFGYGEEGGRTHFSIGHAF